jgi:CubicO group peptidase (beta-lactamase class C family)
MLYPYAYKAFYEPLGAGTLGYLPLNRFDESRIVPTENDMFFRRQLLRGYVHDPGAAMLGGIAGHAGLFSNANDLAKMMQMFLNWGSYGDKEYLDSATIRTFTSRVYEANDNRRALGFDRPVIDEPDEGPACNSASASSYGHSGFTGTLAWMDPEFELLFIFLSNRVHPNQSNTKLLDQNVRTNIQQVLYDAIEK